MSADFKKYHTKLTVWTFQPKVKTLFKMADYYTKNMFQVQGPNTFFIKTHKRSQGKRLAQVFAVMLLKWQFVIHK